MSELNHLSSRATIGGVFHCAIRRDGKIIDEWDEPNLVTNEGLNHALDAVLSGGTQITSWYIGIFEGNATPAATWTAANVTANSTECTAYDEATRQAWTEAGASSQSITNSAAKATFTINATKTVYGAFLVSNSTKSATTGTLFSAARFSASRALVAADELLVTYTVNATTA